MVEASKQSIHHTRNLGVLCGSSNESSYLDMKFAGDDLGLFVLRTCYIHRTLCHLQLSAEKFPKLSAILTTKLCSSTLMALGVSKVASLLCAGIFLLALALTPGDAATTFAVNGPLSGGQCYNKINYNDSPYFDNGMVAQVPSSDIKGGKGCGTCYRVSCKNHRSCNRGKAVTVRAINDGGSGFNLNYPAWDIISRDRNAGNVQVEYIRVPCPSDSRIAVMIMRYSSKWNFAIQILRVGKSGGVEKVEISSDGNDWKSMRKEGAPWVLNPATGVVDTGSAVSVRVTALGSKRHVVLQDVIPGDWSAGAPYESDNNF
ncbi:unnamed protein product [Closterium sp. Yama58-4]|nr:unnamed protein product [Closterium sp. Yama58-4]